MFAMMAMAAIVNILYAGKFSNSEPVCKTPICEDAASKILEFMDPTYEPCQNFYQFACGKFMKEAIIPGDSTSTSVFTMIRDKVINQIKETVESNIENSDPRALKSLKTFYRTCMNMIQIEDKSEKEFRRILDELGDWPIMKGQDWDEAHFEWNYLIYKVKNFGYSTESLIKVSVEVDEGNRSNYVIKVNGPSLGIPKPFLDIGLDNYFVKAALNHLTDLAVILGANREESHKAMEETIKFRMELSKISSKKNYTSMTIDELERKYLVVPWTEYINKILEPHDSIQPTDKIVIKVPEYLEALPKLLDNTSPRIVYNYILSRVVLASTKMLGERFQESLTKYYEAGWGADTREPRWKECLRDTMDNYHIAISGIYAEKYFNSSAKSDAVEIIENLRESFREIIAESGWMDEKTKSKAFEKLSSMKSLIAYPDEVLDDKKVDEYYKDLKVYSDNYLKNVLSQRLFKIKLNIERLRKTTMKDWTSRSSATIVNGYYEYSDNSIEFPAGILQDRLFTYGRPNYMNYASIGVVIGHEITHGFDNKGRRYDKNGHIKNWWTEGTKQKFDEKTQCMVYKYNSYIVPVGKKMLMINGEETLAENIADNGGIKEAYHAYIKWQEENYNELPLPNLSYTPKQLFWISAANILCTKYKDLELEELVKYGKHSPEEFRVIGAFSNIPEFSKDFNCSLGSTMNPERKCTVW